MDLIIPQIISADTGKDMPVLQIGPTVEIDPRTDTLPSIEFFQALETSAHPLLPSETETIQPAVHEGEDNRVADTEPVAEILEGWSGMTASLRADPAGDYTDEIIRPDRWETNFVGREHASVSQDTHQSMDTVPDAPTGFRSAETDAEFEKSATVADSVGETLEIEKDSAEPPISAHETALQPVAGRELALRAPAVVSDATNPAPSDHSEGGSTRITRLDSGPIATREASAMPPPPAARADDPASYAPSSDIPTRNISLNSVDSTTGIAVQKAVPQITGSPDLSAPPPAISDQASTSEAGLQISTRSPIAYTGSVLRQITDAVVTMRDEMVEIMLSPEELGRVRMVLTGHDRAPHLTIWAERPDILDQMRRNSDTLLQQFNDEGLADTTLNFQGGRREDPEGKVDPEWPLERGDSDQHGKYVQTDLDHAAPVLPMRTGSQRIDIRV